MINGALRSRIDSLWTDFWTGGITNPLTVIEQISYLMFARMLDMQEDVAERKANRTGKAFDRLFPNTPDGQLLRWKNFRNMSGKELHSHLKQKVYPFFAQLGGAEGEGGEREGLVDRQEVGLVHRLGGGGKEQRGQGGQQPTGHAGLSFGWVGPRRAGLYDRKYPRKFVAGARIPPWRPVQARSVMASTKSTRGCCSGLRRVRKASRSRSSRPHWA